MERLKELLDKKYSENVYIEIFKILQNKENYSSNSNGVFFNLKNVKEENINSCVEYLTNINSNIEDHFEQLSVRENLEKDYKTILNEKKPKKTRKVIQQKIVKELKPVKPKKLKGAYSRINDILHGRKNKDKKETKKEESDVDEDVEIKKILEKEKESDVEISDKEILIEDEDLFGESSDEDI